MLLGGLQDEIHFSHIHSHWRVLSVWCKHPEGLFSRGKSLCEAQGRGVSYIQPSRAQQPLVELKGRKEKISSACRVITKVHRRKISGVLNM